jgi:hypothetical protein
LKEHNRKRWTLVAPANAGATVEMK